MPVRWRNIAVPLLAGLDTKTDEKALQLGQLSNLENGVFERHGTIKKRSGYDILKDETTGNVEINNSKALASVNNELVLMDDHKLYSFSEAADRWIDKGAIESVVISTSVASKLRTQQTLADMATVADVTVMAWYDSRGTARYSVINTSTGAAYYNDESLGANTTQPRVVAVGGFIHIYFLDTAATALKLKKISPTDLATTVAASSTTLYADVRGTSPSYDVDVAGSRVRLVYTKTANETVLGQISSSGSVDASLTISDAANYGVAISCHPTQSLVGVVTSSTAGGVVGRIYNGFSLLRTGTVQASGATTYRNLTACWERSARSDGEYHLMVFWEKAAASVSNTYLYLTQYGSVSTGATAIPSAADFLRHCGLGSKAFATDDYVYVNLVHESTLQSTYFLVRQDKVIVGRTLPGTAGGLTSSSATIVPHLPHIHENDDGTFDWLGIYKTRLESVATLASDNAVYTEKGIKVIKYDFDSDQSHKSCQVGNTLYVNGGFLWQYDGHSCVESGFHLYPENVTAAASNGSGSLTVSSSYSYHIYYEWVNARGEIERSSFAGAVSVTLGASDDTVTLTIPTLSHTGKTSPRTEVSIAVYRTEADPSDDAVFYRVSKLDPTQNSGANKYLANDPTTDTVTFEDNYADTTITSLELDYQNSGELDNITPPPASVLAQGKQRVFLAGFEDKNLVLFSKQPVSGRALEFNDALTIKVDEDGGAITGLAVLNESLIVFKERMIYVVDGDGSNNLGVGGFNEAQLITSDAGCTNQASISVIPDGIVFQSEKGIYLLGQNRQLSYIGAAVEAYNDLTVTAATLSSSKNQVVFLTDGKALVYDYLFGQWSTWTNHVGVSACSWQGNYCYAKSTGVVYKENQAKWLDGDAPYSMVIETAWVRLSGMQGYQRCRELHLIGDYRSAHDLRVDIAYDYEPYTQTVTMDPDAFMNTSTYGSGATYGSDSYYGGSGSSAYQMRVLLGRQKCESLKVRVTDVPSSSAPGEGFSLNELVFRIGLKAGLMKPQSGKGFGSS